MMSINESRAVDRRESRWLRLARLLTRYGLSSIPFIEVGLFLSAQPAHALLLFFLPPVLASLFILADNGRFEKTIVRGAWVLLSITAIASFFAEINILPVKPQFAGILPPRMDRVFVFYLIGWYAFVLAVCPVWFLRWRLIGPGRSRGPIHWKFKFGLAVWFVGVIAFAILAGRKLF